MNFLYKITRIFSFPCHIRGSVRNWALEPAFVTAQTLIRIYYLFLLYYAMFQLPLWQEYSQIKELDLLWPVFWIRFFDPSASAHFILGYGLVAALAGSIWCRQRWIRVLVFLSVLQFLALKYSFGRIGHSMHLWLITSFIFVFLPVDWVSTQPVSRMTRYLTLRVFWLCQAIVMLTYTMAGIGKLGGAIYQLAIGQIHAFHPDAFALHIADRLITTHSESILGPWFIEHAIWGWPMMLVAVYFQFFAFWAAFRPSLHRLWAVALIGFHIGSAVTLSINFRSSIFLVGLLFLSSPFYPEKNSWGHVIASMPIIGIPFRAKLRTG